MRRAEACDDAPAPRLEGRPVARVLMTADAVGGVWRYSVDLCRALRTRGVRTTLAVMGPSPSAAQRREAQEAGAALVEGPYRLEWMDDPWEDVDRAGTWLLDLARVAAPDVVHLNGYAHAALPWSRPVLVVAHSCVRTWWRAVKGTSAPPAWERYRRAVAAGLGAARVVVAPTDAMRRALQHEYGVPTPSVVIPNAGARDALPEPAGEAKEPLVLAAGRAWDEAKNIQALCAVATSLAWPVVVAGDPVRPGGDACALGAATHLGHLEPAALADWYRRAAIYALPARYEPFGLSVLEAAGAGCALVLGDIPSLRENWDGAAVFVRPGDGRALEGALSWLIADAAGRRALAGAAWERAHTFSAERTAAAYLSVYERLLT